MVGAYYFWEYIVNMSDSIKTGIISVTSKNEDYIKIWIQELTMIKLLQHKENSYKTVLLR